MTFYQRKKINPEMLLSYWDKSKNRKLNNYLSHKGVKQCVFNIPLSLFHDIMKLPFDSFNKAFLVCLKHSFDRVYCDKEPVYSGPFKRVTARIDINLYQRILKSKQEKQSIRAFVTKTITKTCIGEIRCETAK